MTKYFALKIYHILFICFLMAAACQTPDASGSKNLGAVSLVVNGTTAAQEQFEKGLLYLHSFEYLEARNAFVKAQQMDPNCSMAYWGELMAYNQPLFNKEFLKPAQSTLAKLGTTKSARSKRFKTELEKDLFESVEILYGQGSKSERHKAYNLYLEKLVKKYPKNHEISAFYSLSLLGSPRTDKTESLYDRSARIATGILKENPNHPGALHYLIHSYDYPTHAHLALDAADRYSKVAKDATHALHMPSHIYLALGRWDDVINSNIDSWNASIKTTQKYPKKELGYHSLSWLQYGLLQRNENEAAELLLEDMGRYGSKSPSILARSYMVAMQGIYMTETNTWEGPLSEISYNFSDLHLTKRTGVAYLQGMKAFFKKDKAALQKIIKQIGVNKYNANQNLGEERLEMCNTAGNPSIPPNRLDISIVTIIEKELEAALLQLNNRNDLALKKLEEGTRLYESLKMAYGPPVIFKPIHEAYAEALVLNKEYTKALDIISAGLKHNPGRIKSLQIKEKITKQLGLEEDLKKVQNEIANNLAPKTRKKILAL